MNERDNPTRTLLVMAERGYSFSMAWEHHPFSVPICTGNAQTSALVAFSPQSHLPSPCGFQKKAVPSCPLPCEVESDVKRMDFEVHTRSWQGLDFCIHEVSYRSALVHSKPQASGCGCLHRLLHPSREPNAFHHKAIECFLSCTGRRCLL